MVYDREKPMEVYIYDPWTRAKVGNAGGSGSAGRRGREGRKNGTTVIA